jgi:molybdate transport system ATP-binding protein
MSEGSVAALGTVDDILGRADLRNLTGRHEAGALLRASVESHDERFGLTHLAFDGGRLRTSRLDLPIGTNVRVNIRARDVSIALNAPADISILNVLPARITEVFAGDGTHTDLKLALGSTGHAAIWARLTARSVHDLRLEVGRNVFALIKAVAIDRQSLGGPQPDG